MIILGVDPGSHVTGYGAVVDAGRGKLTSLGWGTVKTVADAPLPARLKTVADGLRGAIERFAPDVVALEESFFAKDVSAAMKLGHVRGVVMLVAEEAGKPVAEYAPRLIKQTVTGYGAADKKQVQTMVRHLLALAETPTPYDAADALAIALTHAVHAKTAARLAR
jgi:crossover junction endodeoxyribonuclease RuvC